MTEYLLGLATLPAACAAWWIAWHLVDKNCGIECMNCGRILGEPGVNNKQATLMRWRLHYIRYRGWDSWTCKEWTDD